MVPSPIGHAYSPLHDTVVFPLATWQHFTHPSGCIFFLHQRFAEATRNWWFRPMPNGLGVVLSVTQRHAFAVQLISHRFDVPTELKRVRLPAQGAAAMVLRTHNAGLDVC